MNRAKAVAPLLWLAGAWALLLVVTFLTHRRRSEERRRRVPTPRRLRVLSDLLSFVSTHARSVDVQVFLTYGTLLGFVRQADFICYDFDVDLGVYGTTAFRTLRTVVGNALRGHKRYVLSRSFSNPFMRFFAVVDRDTDLNVDVFCYRPDGAGGVYRCVPRLYTTSVLGECAPTWHSSWLLPLRPAVLAGSAVWIPHRPDRILACVYGGRYLIPDHVCDDACSACRRT